ncbi:MarR family winged helix-turn-helix transcriptional regulator [uncultured Parolsenella sp.]|uniref:MarR family winged helix-turn-helix transcriptional regulator n=1 Tax=uncultured Parolsenella sp. TaxID=2083008 RepID=UPI0025DF6586|nr:MarR family winged helix-turn-helix transcriptional regulator [uncultured Parolsenella sp.]
MEQQEAEGFAPCGRVESRPLPTMDDPFRPRWMDIADPIESQCAHIVDMLGFCGHYLHIHGGGRSGRAPIICALLKHGDAMPQRELMNMFDLKAGSLSEVLTKIERDGLIERTRDPQDRRQLIVQLTPEGHAQALEEQTRREGFRADALTCLTREQRNELENMLDLVKEHWKSIDPYEKGDCPCSKN